MILDMLETGLLLSGNVTELVANNQKEISNVAEKFWNQVETCDIFFTDAEDIVQLGIPISATPSSSDSQFQLTRKLKLPSELKKRPQFPLVRQHDASRSSNRCICTNVVERQISRNFSLGVTNKKHWPVLPNKRSNISFYLYLGFSNTWSCI